MPPACPKGQRHVALQGISSSAPHIFPSAPGKPAVSPRLPDPVSSHSFLAGSAADSARRLVREEAQPIRECSSFGSCNRDEECWPQLNQLNLGLQAASDEWNYHPTRLLRALRSVWKESAFDFAIVQEQLLQICHTATATIIVFILELFGEADCSRIVCRRRIIPPGKYGEGSHERAGELDPIFPKGRKLSSWSLLFLFSEAKRYKASSKRKSLRPLPSRC